MLTCGCVEMTVIQDDVYISVNPGAHKIHYKNNTNEHKYDHAMSD